VTAHPLAAPVHGGDHWKQACSDRHWHLYADEVNGRPDDPGAPRIDLAGRAEQAVARSPEDVLAWMRDKVDQAAARVTPKRASELDRVRDPKFTELQAAALSWGKGTGLGVRLTDTQSLRLLAVPAGSTAEFPGQETCTKPHKN
jgi:hypothetical protein